MKKGCRFPLLSLVFLCALISCGTFPKNAILKSYDPTKGYRYDNLKPGDKNSDSLFVVLAFSGGGTRSASLSYGVLEALRDAEIQWNGRKKRLLDEVDIISSVSGGSFTAAYYALHRDGLFDGTFDRDFLKKDIQKALLGKALSPVNWPKLAGPSYGRSDLAAAYYDSHIFGKATFQQLIDRGTRPFLFLNTTDMTIGAQFPFIQEQFDLICSDLAEMPVARAVAASSAFPGLLTPLTLKNYAGECHYREPEWVGLAESDRRVAPERSKWADNFRSYYRTEPWEKKREYIHLLDGGVADNIGLRSIIFALETTDPAYSILRQIDREAIQKLVIIVVNAGTDPQSSRDTTARVPGLVDVIQTTAVVPLENYSFDTVNRVKADAREYTEAVKIREACRKILAKLCPGSKLPGGDLYAVDVYLCYVSFDFIKDPKERFKFKNLPTTFALPAETVEMLKQEGKKLLSQDEDFTRLLRDLQ